MRLARLPLVRRVLMAALLGVVSAGPARADELDEVAERIGVCFGREDPTCAEPLVKRLAELTPGAVSLDYSRGFLDLLAGRLEPARAALQRVAGSQAPTLLRDQAQQLLELVDSTIEVHAGAKPHPVAQGRIVAWLRPGADEVLLPYLERVLGAALPALEAAFGPVKGPPIALHVYGRADDLARVSGLTVEQVRTSGTIALCKYNRLMLTSPADLMFGYPWADTVNHELVHWFVQKRGGAGVPVWLHEALARSFEGAWRQESPVELDRDERAVLAAARKSKKFITLKQMSPSLALLPSQEDAQLAYAEVHHLLAWALGRAAQTAGHGQGVAAEAGRLVGLFAAGLDDSAALAQLTGLPPSQWQAQWRRELAQVSAGEVQAKSVGHELVFRNDPRPAKPLPEAARKHAELADRLAVLNRPAAAAIEYRKALAAAPQEGPILVARLLRVLLDLQRTDEAEQLLAPALATYPEHAPLHVLRARLEVAAKRWQSAIEASDRAAWLNPLDPQVHMLAAEAQAALGHAAEAEASRGRARLVQAL